MFSHEQSINKQLKAKELLEKGKHPYCNASNVNRTITTGACKEKYLSLLPIESTKEDGQQYIETLTGRIKFLRLNGKSGFMHLENYDGIIQLFVSFSEVGEEQFYIFNKLMEMGDIISATGYPFYTKTGELTIYVSSLDILTKSIMPFPDKFHGLEDKELRYKKRYLDMIANGDAKDVLIKRSKIISDIRNFMTDKDYLEVETPILNAIPGGANARPFTTYHNALDVERFLRIAPELYLKRLIVGGMEKVFEIGKNFRNEGIDATHNPEFTSMEFYSSYETYEDLMIMIEKMVTGLFNKYREDKDNMIITYGKHNIDFSKWDKISYKDSLIKIGNVPQDIVENKEKIIQFLKDKNIIVNEGLSLGKLWEKLFDEFVEEKLSNPTFITEYPVDISPLARRHDTNPMITERFELFMAGREIANGFNELNDPIDQYERFKQQVDSKVVDDEAMHMDTDFVEALMYAMPPTAGAGIGIDRLVMILTNQHSIRDVIAFPTMK